MNKFDIKKLIYYLIILIVIFSLDRISKLYVLDILSKKGQIVFVVDNDEKLKGTITDRDIRKKIIQRNKRRQKYDNGTTN